MFSYGMMRLQKVQLRKPRMASAALIPKSQAAFLLTMPRPKAEVAADPKERLSSPIRPMLLAACIHCKAANVEKRDPRSDDTKR
jgi:hypothetical protein